MTINSFKNYLIEEEKTVYFTFGRLNPPTIGHEKLLTALATKAGRNPYRIFLSPSQDQDKNPLQYKEKVKIARKMFPRHARSIIMSPKTRNVMEVASAIYNEGFKNVVMVVGSDRVNEFTARLKAVNGKKGRHGFFNFAKIDVISAGNRDPDAEGTEGMSASKMRAAASSNDFPQFSQGLPKAVSNAEAKKIYNAVRSGMGLKEQKTFKNHIQLEPVSEIRESYMDGKLFEVGDEVVIKNLGIIAEVKHLGTNYVIVESKGEVYRKWLTDVEKVNPNDEFEYEVHDFVKLSEGREDPDIGDMKGTQPSGYYKGIKKKSTKKARAAHFKKYAEKPGDGPDKQSNYKKAPGDATAETKPSRHTLKFRQMFGDDKEQNEAVGKVVKKIAKKAFFTKGGNLRGTAAAEAEKEEEKARKMAQAYYKASAKLRVQKAKEKQDKLKQKMQDLKSR